MVHFETRDDPDDLPTIHQTCAAAERSARRRAKRIRQPVLIYEVDEHGERYLGTAE